MMDKKALRLAGKAKRSALTMSFCMAGSAKICETLLQLPIYRNAKTIMAYLAMPKEVNLDAFILAALQEGKEVYVPVCGNQRGVMEATRMYSFHELTEDTMHIRAPQNGNAILQPENIDLIFVPGVVFDDAGGRVGMGAGYYDRFLPATERNKRIAIAWQTQLITEKIPMDSLDCYMGAIITEEKSIFF